MGKLLYGCAYYDEYMPYERLQKDMRMLKEAGMNVIRIAESTWSTEEPAEGVFDFSSVKRTIKAAAEEGLYVIVGTPTYAIPPWLAVKHPEILAITERGQGKYGARQNMDITSPAYLHYAERIIRKLMEAVQDAPNVIGFQLDNETKHYQTAGPNVQKKFVRHLREKFGTVEAMNAAYGFAYWSNAVDAWENVPDATGTINGSFLAEFEEFRRGLVTEFLFWQRSIVEEYRKEEQFVTHNFDYQWRGYSFGIQPDVDHKKAAKSITLTGCDIYHPSQEKLTGKEIAFCGDAARGLRHDNYLVLETQAQGHVNWTPFKGQLRLQAFSHLASGADMVEYWHWHSIHNSIETYWKGLLSHDLEPNVYYHEAATIGKDMQRLEPHLVNLKKKNKVAMLASNASLTALSRYPLFPMPGGGVVGYNDVVRRLYDALYELNVEIDILFPEDAELFGNYQMLVVPALYSASDELLEKLANYAKQGGNLVATFKTGFSDENMKVRTTVQPHPQCFGVCYDSFTEPQNVSLQDDIFALSEEERKVSVWMEFLRPAGAEILASYAHPQWKEYAAVTRQAWGKGTATYIGCFTSEAYTKALFVKLLNDAGIEMLAGEASFPIVIKSGVNKLGKTIHYYFNYSGEERTQTYLHGDATELLSGTESLKGKKWTMPPWGFYIFEEGEKA